MSDPNMRAEISLDVKTKNSDAIDKLTRQVRALEASLKSITRQMQTAAKAASQPSGSRPSQTTKTNQRSGNGSADKRAASDLYSFRSRLEAQRQREAARNEAFLHRLRQSSFRQAERDNAKALRDRVAGEARVAREAKAAQAATVRAAAAEMRAIRERIQFGVRTSAQRVREQAATERARAAQAAAIVREQRQTAREEAKALRERMNFVSRMANQRAREESASERDRQAAMRESIRLDRYRMSLRDREERRLHRESVARDSERDRLRGSAISNARSAVHHGSEGFNRTTRTIAGAGAVAAGAGALATRTGIGARMETDTAETNLKIFSEQTQAQIREARRGWLDREAIRNGLNVAGGLNAYGEVLKTGMKNPVENTKSIIGAVSALELDLKDTTKLAGLIDRNYGANSSPAKIKSALNAIAVAAREDPTQAPEIVEGMKRGFGALSMGNMKPEELAALVSGGQSVGIQPGKAGTFIATLGKQLSSGANKFLDPKNRRELNFAASSMGFGNSREMARQFREDSTGTIMKVLESMKAMDPTKRTTVASALSGNQWNDEDLQIVNGLDGLKNTLAAVRDPSNAGFVDDAAQKRQQSWLGQWNSTRAIFNRFWESFGAGFDEILVAINSYFLDLHGRFDFDQITDIVKQGLEGVKDALGVKSWRELLSGMFGGNLAGVGQEVRAFAKGFTAGVMEIVNGIKSVAAFFAGPGASTEQIGKLVGRLITLAAACVIVAPAISIISSLAGLLVSLGKGIMATWAMLKGAGLIGAASSAATAGLWATAGAVIAAAFLAKVANSLGILNAPDPSKGWKRNILEFLDPGLARRILGDEASEAKGTPSVSRGATDSWDAPIVSPNDVVRKPTEDLRKAIEDNTLIQKQSYEANDNFAGLIRKASFTSGDVGRITRATIQGGGADLKSAVTSGSTGVVGSGGPLSSSSPGSGLRGVGIGGRGIIGGGSTSPGYGPGNGGGNPAASAGPQGPLGDRMKGVYQSFRNAGLDHEAAKSFAAEIGRENGYQERYLYGTHRDPHNGKLNAGMMSWQGDRATSLMNRLREKGLVNPDGSIKKSQAALDEQAKFALDEMKSGALGSRGQRAYGTLTNPNSTHAQRALTLGDDVIKWRQHDPQYAHHRGIRDLYYSQLGGLTDGATAANTNAPVDSGASEDVSKRIGALRTVSQECVALAKAAVGVSGSVTGWRKGIGADQGTLKPGTPIATFLNRNGTQSDRYDGGGTGIRGNNTTHAGVFNKYIRDNVGKIVGMEVIEQFRGSGGPKLKNYMFGQGAGARNGSNYHAVLGPDGQPLGGAQNPMSGAAQVANAAKSIAAPFQDIADKAKPNVEALTSKDWMKRIGGGIPLGQVFKTGPGGFSRDSDGNLTMPDAKSAAEMLTMPRFNGVGASDPKGFGSNLGNRAPLGTSAPLSPVKAGTAGGGSSTTSVSAPITINGANQSPEQIASAVERRLSQNMNRRTHDLDPGSISGIG